MKKTTSIIFFFVLSFHLFGQEVKTTNEDFNNDKVIDSLTISIWNGAYNTYKEVLLINGKTGDTFTLNIGSDFSQIKSLIIIPEELRNPENKPFLEVIKKSILSKKRQYPDESLSWIISGTLSSTNYENNIYYNRIINPSSDWVEGNIELPSSYHCTIQGDTLEKLYNYNKENPLPLHDRQAWIRYYGHNHYSYQMTDSAVLIHLNSDLEIYKTAHGIFALKGNCHKWLFVTDFELTGAPEKLRFESIGKTELYKNHLIVYQKLMPSSLNNIFVINIKNGKCGRINFMSISDEDNFQIIKGTLSIDSGYIEIPMKKLIRELKKCK